jgi:hypothetical protein
MSEFRCPQCRLTYHNTPRGCEELGCCVNCAAAWMRMPWRWLWAYGPFWRWRK